MSDLDHLYAQILAAPTDPTPRRAYADAVRTKDPARAELIDIQLAMKNSAVIEAPPPQAARNRARQLIEQFGATWTGKLARLVTSCEWFGGFVEGVELTPAQMAAHGAELTALAPLRRLTTRGLHGHVDALLALPFLSRIVSLDVLKNQLTDSEVMQLAAAPQLAQLVVLNLGKNLLSVAALRALAALTQLQWVETIGTGVALLEPADDNSLRPTVLSDDLINELGQLPWLVATHPPPAAGL